MNAPPKWASYFRICLLHWKGWQTIAQMLLFALSRCPTIKWICMDISKICASRIAALSCFIADILKSIICNLNKKRHLYQVPFLFRCAFVLTYRASGVFNSSSIRESIEYRYKCFVDLEGTLGLKNFSAKEACTDLQYTILIFNHIFLKRIIFSFGHNQPVADKNPPYS